MGPIVTAATTPALPRDVVIVHVEAGDPDHAVRMFAEGHLPDARLLLRDEVTARPMVTGDGRHPLPSPEAFAASLGRHGLDATKPVLAYDREHGASAARLVYLLRILGQPAAVLDGGIDGFEDPLETGLPPQVDPVEVPVRPWPADMLPGIDQIDEHVAEGGLLLDARAAARFRGETEPLDPVAGHIPGARNAPFGENLDRKGLFKAAPKLHAMYEPLGADGATIVYCGSGVTAAHDALAIEHSGLGLPRLFIGSFSQWCRDPSRAIATGE